MDHASLKKWFAAYDAASLHPADLPPPHVVALAQNARVVVTSDLPRAVASARALRAEFETSELLRESVLPIPLFPLRLPLMFWATATGIRWYLAMRRGEWPTPDERERAARAAEWLGERAGEETVLAVTHSVFRRALAEELLRQGWVVSERWRGNRYWSVLTLTRHPLYFGAS